MPDASTSLIKFVILYFTVKASFSCLATEEVKISVGLSKASLRGIKTKFPINLMLYNSLYILIKNLDKWNLDYFNFKGKNLSWLVLS